MLPGVWWEDPTTPVYASLSSQYGVYQPPCVPGSRGPHGAHAGRAGVDDSY